MVHVSPEEVKAFGEGLSQLVVKQLERKANYLRLSNLGTSCRRKLWYSINCAELAEPLSGPARIKFLIGDITEAVILFLARLAGHAVTDEQKSVALHGVKGHIDAKINGEVTDVKSASPASFKKFEAGLAPESDGFGYLTQLGSYVQAEGGSRGHFLAVDKVLGTLVLDTHDSLPNVSATQVREVREILDSSEVPDRGFEDEAMGEAGNRVLKTVPCGYCEFKHTCWPGLQIRQYYKGPVHFTKIVKEPILGSKRVSK